MKGNLLSLIVLVFYFGHINGNIVMPKIFGDNMVLQREMKIPIWGKAANGEVVTVEIGGHYAETVTKPDGRWKIYLGPLDAGGPYQLKISGHNTIVFNNVMVGEVWLCSGQSNMAMEVRNCKDASQEIENANYPLIRHFQVIRSKASERLEDIPSVGNLKEQWLNTWEICTPATVEHFTGAGYFFALNLYKKLNIPVGIIHSSWGGTTAEAWTPYDTLGNDQELHYIIKNWPDYNNDEEWLKQEYEGFLKEVEKAKATNLPTPLYFNQPSVLFNAMISPVIPYGIKGTAWYQGESNAYRAYQYKRLLPALIKKWRSCWGEGDFPFLIVQLANYSFQPNVFPELREAQKDALIIPNTALVVTIDLGDSANIHPANKQEVGRRLFLAAENLAYKSHELASGPCFKSMTIANAKCFLTFSHVGDGLISKNGKTLTGFEVAGNDKIFHKALAEISGDTILVSSSEVIAPVAVRYAWANHPGHCDFYNSLHGTAFLPASPFRTDDWPGITYNRK